MYTIAVRILIILVIPVKPKHFGRHHCSISLAPELFEFEMKQLQSKIWFQLLKIKRMD